MSPSEAIEEAREALRFYASCFEGHFQPSTPHGPAEYDLSIDVDALQEDGGLRASRALAALNEVASAQIAGEGWRTMESAPVCEAILATCRVKNMKGDQWWETYRIVIDDETGEIDTDIDQPWSLEDYEFWQPLPAPPAPAETEALANQETNDE
jgi:hypothetical protein